MSKESGLFFSANINRVLEALQYDLPQPLFPAQAGSTAPHTDESISLANLEAATEQIISLHDQELLDSDFTDSEIVALKLLVYLGVIDPLYFALLSQSSRELDLEAAITKLLSWKHRQFEQTSQRYIPDPYFKTTLSSQVDELYSPAKKAVFFAQLGYLYNEIVRHLSSNTQHTAQLLIDALMIQLVVLTDENRRPKTIVDSLQYMLTQSQIVMTTELAQECLKKLHSHPAFLQLGNTQPILTIVKSELQRHQTD